MSIVDLTVEITFFSDWSVGTGTGLAGDLDSVIMKDDVGLPMIPAKTVTGILRSACEEAAAALADGGDTWHPVVDHIFGSQPGFRSKSTHAPVPAALSIRPALLPSSQRDYVRRVQLKDARSAELLRAAATTVRASTEINKATGTAATGSLRFEERGRAGQVLTAVASIACSSETLAPDVETLLACGAALVDRLGGKRRRGAGKCQVRVLRDGRPLVPDWNAEPCHPSVTSPANGPESEDSSETQISGEIDRIAVVRVECLTPVITGGTQRGNVLESLDYIPGTMLLPVVARALGSSAARLIGSGQLVVTDATPATEGERLVPVARCWQMPKGTAGADLHNGLHGDSDVRTVPVRRGWCRVDRVPKTMDDVRQVDLVERAHAVIDDEKQRPTEETGGLFVVEAIAPGTALQFEVWGPANTTLRLPQETWIGRSKKDDYGLVTLTCLQNPTQQSGTSNKGDTEPADTDADGVTITAWLTSDTLVLNDQLRYTTRTTDVADLIASALGVRRVAKGSVKAYADVRRHEGWLVTPGLPRPALVAVTGGSVFRFTVDKPPKAKAIAKVEQEGVGDRRAEGFGRVLINPKVLEKSDRSREEDQQSPDSPAVMTHEGPAPAALRPPLAPDEVDLADDDLSADLYRTAMGLWLCEAAVAAAYGNVPDELGMLQPAVTTSTLGSIREAVLLESGWKVSLTTEQQKHLSDPLKALLGHGDGAAAVTTMWEWLGADQWAQDETSRSQAWQVPARRALLLACISRSTMSIQGAAQRTQEQGGAA